MKVSFFRKNTNTAVSMPESFDQFLSLITGAYNALMSICVGSGDKAEL